MKLTVVATIVLLLLVAFVPVVYGFVQIDTQTHVTSVIDGVTFETDNGKLFKLADIEPTCTDVDNSTGYITPKSLLSSLIERKSVYLDIDSLYVTDFYGTDNKTVCVAYLDYNSTHYLNVNQALLTQRLVVASDVENDFNPTDWTDFAEKQNVPEFTSGLILSLFLITTLVVTIYTNHMKYFKD